MLDASLSYVVYSVLLLNTDYALNYADIMCTGLRSYHVKRMASGGGAEKEWQQIEEEK